MLAVRLDKVEFHVVGQERRIAVLEGTVHQLGSKVGLEII